MELGLNESTMKFVVAGVLAVVAGRYIAPIVGGFVKNDLLTGLVMVVLGGVLLSQGSSLMKGLGAGVVVAGAISVLSAVWPSK